MDIPFLNHIKELISANRIEQWFKDLMPKFDEYKKAGHIETDAFVQLKNKFINLYRTYNEFQRLYRIGKITKRQLNEKLDSFNAEVKRITDNIANNEEIKKFLDTIKFPK